ncbi:hypothetical protein ACFQY5_09125 [Paeniroseomonas aquatica]|uniref:hypothetical protein n=1 Tax=Paeniroseomonas aquatica TaxID=373043 RepID=UPI00360F3EBD
MTAPMKPVSASALASPSGFCSPISRKPKMTMKQEISARMVPSGTPQGSSVSRIRAAAPAARASASSRPASSASSQAMTATKSTRVPMTSPTDQAIGLASCARAGPGERIRPPARWLAAGLHGTRILAPSCSRQKGTY